MRTPVALAIAVLVTGCGPGATSAGPARDPSSDVSVASRGFRLSQSEREALAPDLLAELRADEHHYFRYIARRFVATECELGADGPVVNLHGDPHVEQYLVTTLGRGLGDFDEATIGPVSIDLLRLATSIRIASRVRGWDAGVLWSGFLEGYVASLADPSAVAPEPTYAALLRATFHHDHGRLLTYCDSLIRHIDDEAAAGVEIALSSYVEQLSEHRPDIDPRAFEVVRLGRHDLGIASRAVTNYVIRTRGATDDPADDMVLEAKAVTTNPDAHCLPLGGRPDALRILVADARLAYTPFRDVGAIEIRGQPYWVHEWVDDYQELRLEDERLTEEMMREVLFDAGVQLGQGHPRGVSAPYGSELRTELSRYVNREAQSIWTRSGALSDEVLAAWTAIR